MQPHTLMLRNDGIKYVRGYRFSDDPKFYNAAAKTFRDLANFGDRAKLTMNVGTPAFNTVNQRTMLRLDNTAQGFFEMPIAFEGAVVMALKPNFVSGGPTISQNPLIFGDAVSVSSNPRLFTLYSSANRSIGLNFVGGTSVSSGRTDDTMRVLALGSYQNGRTSKLMTAAGAVTSNNHPASSTNGNACALQSAANGVRFGNLTGDSLTTDTSGTFFHQIAEIHFFRGAGLFDGAPGADLAALLARLAAEYGAV